jgi:hypothetical protein
MSDERMCDERRCDEKSVGPSPSRSVGARSVGARIKKSEERWTAKVSEREVEWMEESDQIQRISHDTNE